MSPWALLLSAFLAAAPEPLVLWTSPPAGTPVSGRIELTVEVDSESPIAHVTFFVDHRAVARIAKPPFRAVHDLGPSNRPHRFEAVAETRDGQRGRALMVSPAIRVDDEIDLPLQQLYITALAGGSRVTDLKREDFRVLDDGQAQEIVTFERGEAPLVALLLVDASDSMRGERLQAALAGARAFCERMLPLDQAKLIAFADGVLHSTPFTNFAEILSAGLAGIQASGDTALNDHLYLALRLLEKEQGRRVILMLSDGIDVTSTLDMDAVLETAQKSAAMIFWLRLGEAPAGTAYYSAWRDAEAHAREIHLLERTVLESGGRIVTLRSLAEVEGAFAEILQELREQFVLGYYPSGALGQGRFRSLEVEIKRPGIEVRTRKGYFDDHP